MTSRSLLFSPFHPTYSVIMIVASISVLLFSPSENPVILKTFMMTSGLIIYGQMDRQICIPELTEISQLNFQLFGEIKTFTHFSCLLFSMTKISFPGQPFFRPFNIRDSSAFLSPLFCMCVSYQRPIVHSEECCSLSFFSPFPWLCVKLLMSSVTYLNNL